MLKNINATGRKRKTKIQSKAAAASIDTAINGPVETRKPCQTAGLTHSPEARPDQTKSVNSVTRFQLCCRHYGAHVPRSAAEVDS